MSAPTLLFGTTDIQTLTGMIINRMDLLAPGTRRGGDDIIPGRQGQIGAQLPYDAYAFNVAVTVYGSTAWEMYANLAAVGVALAGTNGLATLTRRLPTGPSTYVSHTARGRFNGNAGVTLLDPATGQTELQFINESGAWWNGSTWLVP